MMKTELLLRVAPAVAALVMTVAPCARAESHDGTGRSSHTETLAASRTAGIADWLSKATAAQCETSGAADCSVVLAKNPFKHFGHSQKESFQRGKEKVKKVWNKMRGKKTPAPKVEHKFATPIHDKLAHHPDHKPLPATPA